MKKDKQPIAIFKIGSIGNMTELEAYLEDIDLDKKICGYKKPKARKVLGVYMEADTIILPGGGLLTSVGHKPMIPTSNGMCSREVHMDGTLQFGSENQTEHDVIDIILNNMNKDFNRGDLVKLNEKNVCPLLKDGKEENLIEAFDSRSPLNTPANEKLVIITLIGKRGATGYMTEYDSERQEFFGFASLFHDHNDEGGYIPKQELIDCDAVIAPIKQDIIKNSLYYKR